MFQRVLVPTKDAFPIACHAQDRYGGLIWSSAAVSPTDQFSKEHSSLLYLSKLGDDASAHECIVLVFWERRWPRRKVRSYSR